MADKQRLRDLRGAVEAVIEDDHEDDEMLAILIVDRVIEPLMAEHDRATRSILYIIDAVKAHGDRAAITAAHAALAKSSAPNAVDERNELRRQVVDLRDELATMKADRDAKHDDLAVMATERASADVRADEAESVAERIRQYAERYARSGSHAYAKAGRELLAILDGGERS